MPFKKGQSGNPKGRPKGIVTQKKIREAIGNDIPAIVDTLIGLAKSGDVTAARLLLERALPPMKAGDTLVSIPLSGEPAESARSILIAVGEGEITPGTATQLLGSIGTLTRILEASELLKRVEALEEMQNG